MNIKVGHVEREGFVAYYVMEFENGLMLKSNEILWLGKEGREKVKQQFIAVLNNLQAAGYNIVGVIK